MFRHHVFFPHGSRMEAKFAVMDNEIPALGNFISEMAGLLTQGRAVEYAARVAKDRYGDVAAAFNIPDIDAIDADFALVDRLTFPDEKLPASVSFEGPVSKLSLKVNGFTAPDLSAFLALCGSGRRTAEEIRSQIEESMIPLMDGLLEHGILTA